MIAGMVCMWVRGCGRAFSSRLLSIVSLVAAVALVTAACSVVGDAPGLGEAESGRTLAEIQANFVVCLDDRGVSVESISQLEVSGPLGVEFPADRDAIGSCMVESGLDRFFASDGSRGVSQAYIDSLNRSYAAYAQCMNESGYETFDDLYYDADGFLRSGRDHTGPTIPEPELDEFLSDADRCEIVGDAAG